MGWSKPFTTAEIAYIENNYPVMSCASIADDLGRSERGVRNVVKRLNLTESHARANSVPSAPPTIACENEPETEEKQDELSELRAIKRVLKRALRNDAKPSDMPKISAELREVVRRISEIEEGEDGSGGSMAGGSNSIVVSVPLRPA